STTCAQAQFPPAPLPPLPDWSGASEQLIVQADDPWITPAERTGLTETPDYAETMTWLDRLVEAAPELNRFRIGTSAQGRAINMIIADRDGLTDPVAIARTGRALVLAHAGIHSGEIDGKDAGLMLLRDMTVAGERETLLEKASLLFIPILNVDGHERSSAYNRMNQRGPESMGWRTNARNLNLNRDFARLDTRGVRALTSVVKRWQPDLYLDLHVTDGADYQYDITYGWNGPHAWSPAIAGWLDQSLRPAVDRALSDYGHIPGPLIFAANGRDLSDGMLSWTAGPRFSNGWGDARHLPTILVENHSLKPYRQRVLGTYVLMAEALRVAGENIDSLRAAVETDRTRFADTVPMDWQPGTEPGEIEFKGIESELELSEITGTMVPRWTGRPITQVIPEIELNQAGLEIKRPAAYLIPIEWRDIAERLVAQGIRVEVVDRPLSVMATRYQLPDAAPDTGAIPFEGRARYVSGQPQAETLRIELPAGSFRVTTDQPLGTLAVLLLEPQSPDSYFQWGDFASILQRTEYYEEYAMEPLARRMLKSDPALRARFEQKLLAEPAFAGDADARLRWFYRQTPYYDQTHRRYPVLRVPRS
ncbi:MAG: M14 family metallopeptidase, partial [Wenzhouxiangellaceae bacterium]|nr:M14 family metallopeptidase [Wenzhouxiangellaceae bacterium]